MHIPVLSSLRSRRRKGQGVGDREEGKRGGGLGRGGGDACSKNPLLLISADAGVRKFLIG